MKLEKLYCLSYNALTDRIKNKVNEISKANGWGPRRTLLVHIAALCSFIWVIIFGGRFLIDLLIPNDFLNLVAYLIFMSGYMAWLGVSYFFAMRRWKREQAEIFRQLRASMAEGEQAETPAPETSQTTTEQAPT